MSLVLVACDGENWFYHSVEYSGEITNSRMVVGADFTEGYFPRVQLFLSQFFLNVDNKTIRRPIDDAKVMLQVNDEEPVELSIKDNVYNRTDRLALQGGDKVKLRIEHPLYGEAMVEQHIPFFMDVTYDNFSKIDSRGNLHFDMHIPSYSGDSTDVLCVTARAVVSYRYQTTQTSRYRDEQGKWHTVVHDTILTAQYTISSLYAQDESLRRCPEFNTMSENGYYGGGVEGLYFPLDVMRGDKPISCIVPIRRFVLRNEEEMTNKKIIDWQVAGLMLGCQTISHDDYLRNISEYAYRGGHSDGGPISLDPDADDSSEIQEDIEDMFDGLGTMEGVQFYYNVQGNAIGIVRGRSRSKTTTYRDIK